MPSDLRGNHSTIQSSSLCLCSACLPKSVFMCAFVSFCPSYILPECVSCLCLLLTVCLGFTSCSLFCLSPCLHLPCYICISSPFYFLVLMRFDMSAEECHPLGLLAVSTDSVRASFCRHEIAQRRSAPDLKPFFCSSCLDFRPTECKCF